MNDEQFQQLMLAFKTPPPPVVAPASSRGLSSHDLIDNLSKLGVALCTGAIIYVATQMGTLTTSMAVMQAKMETFNKFTEAPRFTAENNAAADARLLATVKDSLSTTVESIRINSGDIKAVKSELDRRVERFNTSTDNDEKHSNRLNELEKKLEKMHD